MRRPSRYAVSATVGIGITVLVWHLTHDDWLVTTSLPFLYGATTAIALDHRKAVFEDLFSRRETRKARKIGAIGGGVGAGTGSLLLQTSIPVGTAGLGLMLLGSVITIAEYESTEFRNS